jgi:hypothetical protein
VEQIVWVVIFFFSLKLVRLGAGGVFMLLFILCFTQAMCEWMDEHVGF